MVVVCTMSEKYEDGLQYLQDQRRFEDEYDQMHLSREDSRIRILDSRSFISDKLEQELYHDARKTPAMQKAISAALAMIQKEKEKKMLFKKAERKKVKLRIGLAGISGSGKTYSALCLAQGIGKKIALIDTENGSASLYADRFEFDSVDLNPPYTVPKFLEAMKAAEQAQYDVLIMDSISHEWAGDGGLLSKKEALDARGGNSFVNWGGITKEHEQFKAAILNCGIHLICTMRSKQEYAIETNDKGRSAPKKLGLAPIQREGMEYEFTTMFDIASDHTASTSKDRTGLFEGTIEKMTPQIGEKFIKWLSEAKEFEPKVNADQIKTLLEKAIKIGLTKDGLTKMMNVEFPHISRSTELSVTEYQQFAKKLDEMSRQPVEAEMR